MIKINNYNYQEYYKGKNLLSISQDSKTRTNIKGQLDDMSRVADLYVELAKENK